jgi:quinol-cytochrome oxidoreductase complex cytochrome b subunit
MMEEKEEMEMEEKENLEEKLEKGWIPFFPHHFLAEVLVMYIMLGVILFLCVYFPVELGPRANPLSAPVGVKPEWYFLFLYAFLHYVPLYVGIFTPALGVIFLIILPFIDKNPERHPLKRPIATSVAILVIIAIIILSFLGLYAE